MIVSKANRFVFVHMPRTGGTAVTKALKSYLSDQDTIWEYMHKHRTITKLAQERGKCILNYYCFTIMRNPWEMIHSDWYYAKAMMLPQHKEWREKNQPKLAEWGKTLEEHSKLSLLDFIIAKYRKPWYKNGIFNYYCSIGPVHMMNYIIHHERMNKDFETVCEAIGLGGVELKVVNSTKKLNSEGRPPYQEDYSDEARLLVESICKQDIEKFNYEF